MNMNLNKIKEKISALFQYIRCTQRLQMIYLGVGIFIFVAIIGILIARSGVEDTKPIIQIREVEVKTVALLASDQTPLEIVGRVRSQTEANLRTEAQGEVTGVYRKVGQFVRAGSIIAEISNRSERASVLEAQARVEQAEANLSKTRSGTRDEQLSILELQMTNANGSLEAAKTNTVNTLLGTYDTIIDAVKRKSDLVFTESFTDTYDFSVQTADSALANKIELDRVKAELVIDRIKVKQDSVSIGSNLDSEIEQTKAHILFVINFLDDVIVTLNKGIGNEQVSQATIASHRLEIIGARTALNSALTNLTNSLDTLNTKRTQFDVAEKNLEQGVTGERAEDIMATEASLKQAQASLQSARAALEKTFIRTPISGTINSLTIEKGDFVSVFKLAAIVSNNRALEIEAFVTDKDKRKLTVGSSVRIADEYLGVITSIAPGVDPETRKIEVRIGIQDKDVDLTHGISVNVSIDRENGKTLLNEDEIIIPIAALKVEADRVVAFTVSEDNTLIAIRVSEGLLIGDKIEIKEGLLPNMKIVVDARGLKEGQEVTIK